MYWKKNINLFNYYIFILLPITLILSSALTNFIVFYISLIGVYQAIVRKTYYFFTNNNYVKFFLLFCIFISLNSLITNSGILSIKSSILFIRYLFFIIGILSIIKVIGESSKKLLNFFKLYIIILIILFIDSNFQILNDGKNIVGYNSYQFQSDRISSFFNDELILGSYVEKFSIICICYLTIFNNKTYKKFVLPILIITLEICLISGERRAFYSFLLFTFFYIFFIYDFNVKNKIVLATTIISTLFLFVYFNTDIKNRMVNNKIEPTNK